MELLIPILIKYLFPMCGFDWYYMAVVQEYEKQMKSFGIGVGSTPSSGSLRQGGSQPGSNLPASLANSKKRVVSSQSMLESRYSKTFIYTPQAKEVKVKEVRLDTVHL